MPTQRPGIGRLLLHCMTAFLLSCILLVITLYSIISQEPNRPEFLQYDIPTETSCLIAASMQEVLPQSLHSTKPHIRLRQTDKHCYELLYWGNPVRPQYTYSVTKVSNRQSVLHTPTGEREDYRPLPVTIKSETKGELPLQPSIPLKGIDGAPGEYYAARISVHDAADNTTLHSAIYLICGDTPQ